MLKSLKKKMKDQAGLTLIELLVVIVILGIIAAVAIPMVMSQQDNAKKKTNAQNESILQDAVNRYYTLNNAYPADIANLALAETNGGSHKGGPFLDKIPAVEAVTGCAAGSDDTAWGYDSAGKVDLDSDCK
jgi:type IV pilus assembly protein PilA